MEKIEIWLTRDSTTGRKHAFSDEIHIRAIFTGPAETLHSSLSGRREIRELPGFQIVLVEILTAARHRIARQPRGVTIREKDLRATRIRRQEHAATAGPRSLRRVDLNGASLRRITTIALGIERARFLVAILTHIQVATRLKEDPRPIGGDRIPGIRKIRRSFGVIL